MAYKSKEDQLAAQRKWYAENKEKQERMCWDMRSQRFFTEYP
jgi:hypothetical protein